MALWEYKVITSGKGGFASATMLETYLNQLGKDEWEIVDFRTDAVNSLVFNGLARRPTLRDWTLEAAIAAAAKAEADKLRVELMNKQYAGDAGASADAPHGSNAPGAPPSASPDSLRSLRDTDRDGDPEALADEVSHGADDWANLDNFEDDLPTFFDALKPHLRKNQNAPGQSVALNYLAKRWEQPEADLMGAMKECGFDIPETEEAAPVFLEYEGDLYWVNRNNRGQYFLNTREKPRPKFRIVPGTPLGADDPVHAALAEEHAAELAEKAKRAAEQAEREAEAAARRAEREAQRLAAETARREQQAAAQAAREAARETARAAAASAASAVGAPAGGEGVAPSNQTPGTGEAGTVGDGGFTPAADAAEVSATDQAALPQGEALLDAIRPQMRRNRNGPGYSGSTTYLAKAFKQTEAAFDAAFAAIGLVPPASGEKPRLVIIGVYVYWVTKDGRGVTWINGRQASAKELAASAGADSQTTEAPSGEAPVAAEEAGAGGGAIFKAVPRMLPPVIASAEPASEPGLAPAGEPGVIAESSVEAPASETPAVMVPAAAPVAVEAEAGADKSAKPVRARKPKAAGESTKPRTKKRVSSAIDADAAAEEPAGPDE
ncbi:MAG: hypothetical protein RIQ79_1240 [Verrucomicrobiota bacterium]